MHQPNRDNCSSGYFIFLVMTGEAISGTWPFKLIVVLVFLLQAEYSLLIKTKPCIFQKLIFLNEALHLFLKDIQKKQLEARHDLKAIGRYARYLIKQSFLITWLLISFYILLISYFLFSLPSLFGR